MMPTTEGIRRLWGWEVVAGRVFDVIVASIALVVLSPLILLIAIVIRLTSRGPVIFQQDRVGLDGAVFTMFKFRTMQAGTTDDTLRDMIAREVAGEDTSVDGSYKLPVDSRVTTIGRWLRRTSMDEIPQFVNVLRGDMALVGPRPCLVWEADLFPAKYAARFGVKPGITGLWQTNGRSNLSTLDMLSIDVTYVSLRSFFGDVAILLQTVPALLTDSSAR
jgi:lipopolysaccharide/colanic/teichoic acid biosynthesis glycosyltransferase